MEYIYKQHSLIIADNIKVTGGELYALCRHTIPTSHDYDLGSRQYIFNPTKDQLCALKKCLKKFYKQYKFGKLVILRD